MGVALRLRGGWVSHKQWKVSENALEWLKIQREVALRLRGVWVSPKRWKVSENPLEWLEIQIDLPSG